MRRLLQLWFTLSGMLAAQTSLEGPMVGKIVDPLGNLRNVSGIAGSFITGAVEARGVRALDCAQSACVSSADAQVIATDGRVVVSYFPENRSFVRGAVGSEMAEPLGWDPLMEGDEVLSIRVRPAGADIAVRRGGSVWVLSQDGAAVDALKAGDGPVLLLGTAVVLVEGGAIVLRRGDGSATRFPAGHVAALYRISSDWVEATGDDCMYSLRVTPGQEALFWLPRGAE